MARFTANKEVALGQLVRTNERGKIEGTVGVGGDGARRKSFGTAAVRHAPVSKISSLGARIERGWEGKWRGVDGLL